MTDTQTLKKRFLSDSSPRRLGGIASDLLRISNLVQTPMRNKPIYQDVLNEVKFFTEWTAPDLTLKQQKILILLQRSLARDFSSKLEEHLLKQEARQWSEKILKISGLLKKR